MLRYHLTTAIAISLAAAIGNGSATAQEHSVLTGPIQNSPPAYESYPTDEYYPDDTYGLPPTTTYEAPYESFPSQMTPIDSSMVYQGEPYPSQPGEMLYDTSCGVDAAVCGIEEIGCGVMPAPACNCGPVCGCESRPLLDGTYVANAGQAVHQLLGDTTQCEPSDFRPGLITWANDFCVRNGFALDSFLVSGCGYFSVDFGLAMTGDRATIFGNTANSLAGLPAFDVQEGSIGRYALGMGSGKRRLELELGFHRNTIDETKTGAGPRSGDELTVDGYRRSTTLMLNGYHDFKNSTFWTPYLKTGVGISHNMGRATTLADISNPASITALGLAGPAAIAGQFPKSSTTKFAWAVGAGLAVDITERIKLDFEYQFLNVGETRTGRNALGDALDFDNGALHELAFGLRFYR